MTEELKEKFNRLTDEEKVAFMKSIMPSFCEIFSKNPEKMMGEMMPMCQEMMKSRNMGMHGMMKTTGMMGGAMRKEKRWKNRVRGQHPGRNLLLQAANPGAPHVDFSGRHPVGSIRPERDTCCRLFRRYAGERRYVRCDRGAAGHKELYCSLSSPTVSRCRY